MTDLADVEFFTPANFADGFPHDIFTRLRAEDPVHWSRESVTPEWPYATKPGPGYWAVTRHADVNHVVRSPHLYSSHVKGSLAVDLAPRALALKQRQLINLDPPDHSSLRRIVSRAFTPKAIRELEDTIRAHTIRILADAAAAGEVDFITAVAAELPLTMLSALLGMPHEERHLLFDWTERLTVFRDIDDFVAATREMREYCLAHSALKRAEPTDDVWSTLVNAELAPDETDDGGAPLTDEDLVMFWELLVIAGNDTTRNATAGGVLALVEHPDQAMRLYRNMDLIPTAIEEVVRWVSPVNLFRRTAVEDTELGGKQIKAGDKVIVYYASANRDEDVFEDPFTFDVGRTPNPHIGFGAGPHHCLGASLARMQLRTMFTELISRYPNSRIVGPVERAPITLLAGISSMPVELRP
ncbi:MAG TPA: cytochrome P450 [Acidimicrobiales bacterium]